MSVSLKSVLVATSCIASLVLCGCGGSESDDSTSEAFSKSYYVDDAVVNLPYSCDSKRGVTDAEGTFLYTKGDICKFYIGDLTLRTINTNNLPNGSYVYESDPKTSALLQSLDKNHLYGSSLELDSNLLDAMQTLKITQLPQTDLERATLLGALEAEAGSDDYEAITEESAIIHMKQTLTSYPPEKLYLTDVNASWVDKTYLVNLDSSLLVDWAATQRVYSSAKPVVTTPKSDYVVLAWSELGMHCMDGSDYSIFSLLPPYSTLKAQLVLKGTSPRIVNGDIALTYEAVQKEDGTINSTSSGKTNFWDYLPKLFPDINKTIEENIGLKGKPAQGYIPELMDYNVSQNLYVAEAIPTIPVNDDSSVGHYPVVKVIARDKNGNILAQTTTTLPVSDEMDCLECHSSKRDVLEKHDQNFPDAVKDYDANLTAKGFDYNVGGLIDTVDDGTPVLCASCHKSNAIANSGIEGVKPLTQAIHGAHSSRSDADGNSLGSSTDRDSCYACHPGKSTKCLRGVMGQSADIECQSCHGTMDAVATKDREGWSDEPNCQACHQETQRYTSAVVDKSTGTLRDALDQRFATEQSNIDTHHRLFKMSSGHGGMACSSCHGAQHAIYPSTLAEENKQNIDLQGYKGTLRECSVCHNDENAITISDGPHGMHTLGQRWVDMHGTVVLRDGTTNCKVCHGDNLEGTFLSKVPQKREFKVGVMEKEVTFDADEKVSCAKCHNDAIMEVSQ